MTGAIDGTFAIGMASRELKDEETAELTGTAIALDGIARGGKSGEYGGRPDHGSDQGLYTGEITDWSEVAA